MKKYGFLFISLFLAFAIVGCTGERGESIVGPSGIDGAAGTNGTEGDKGQTGDKGQAGDKGVTGDKGATGDRGDRGATGATGDAATSCPSNQHRVAGTCVPVS